MYTSVKILTHINTSTHLYCFSSILFFVKCGSSKYITGVEKKLVLIGVFVLFVLCFFCEGILASCMIAVCRAGWCVYSTCGRRTVSSLWRSSSHCWTWLRTPRTWTLCLLVREVLLWFLFIHSSLVSVYTLF